MKDEDLKGFRGYVLFGLDERDLLERIVAFSNGCRGLVFDYSVARIARELCRTEDITVDRIESRDDVKRALARGARGVVFKLDFESLRRIKAIAFVVGVA